MSDMICSRISLSGKCGMGRYALVDPCEAYEVSQYRWHISKVNGVEYAVRTDRSVKPRRVVSMHRHILGAKTGETIDHINRDGLDNRKSNLRFCNTSQNNRNRIYRQIKYMGTVRSKAKSESWEGRGRLYGKQYYLGSFKTREAAHAAYLEFRSKHFNS